MEDQKPLKIQKENKFTIKDHNEMQEKIDSLIVKIQSFDEFDLELQNGIKSLLEASNRINSYYRKINAPIAKNQQSNEDFSIISVKNEKYEY